MILRRAGAARRQRGALVAVGEAAGPRRIVDPGMALHVRGVVLPEDETGSVAGRGPGHVRAGARGRDVVDGGFILPGLVDAHCHIGIRPGGAPIDRLDEARELAAVDRDAGRARDPRRRLARTRTPNSTTTRTCRGWPARAGMSRRRSATCATSAWRSSGRGGRRR